MARALNPTYGISIFTHPYYLHILYSTYRATAAFLLAVLLSGPLGILHGLEQQLPPLRIIAVWPVAARAAARVGATPR